MSEEDETRLVYTVNETAARLGLSRMSTYKGILAGEIPSLKVGSRILVPKVALEKKLAEAGK